MAEFEPVLLKRISRKASPSLEAYEADGGYREPRERAMLFVDGRLDRIIENAAEPCAGLAYAPFAELEKLTR